MPSQKQLKWSQLRVGITVVVAVVGLMLVVFLMSSTTGLFTDKVVIRTYFDNAEGLRVGAPARLQGVDIGNVTAIRVVSNHGLTPVEVRMKVNTRYDLLRVDSVAQLSTAGVLGETFVDIDSSAAKGRRVKEGDVLAAQNKPDLQDVIRSSQTSLQNVDVLVRRLDRIVAAIEQGQGSIGKFIYDPSLYNKLNVTLNEVQSMVNQISSGQGSLGKLLFTDEMHNKLNASVEKIDKIIAQINNGEGSLGKLVKDPELYNNANQTIAKANALMNDINQGKGALGKFAHDEEFARRLDTTITNLHELSSKMNQGQGTVGKLFNDQSVYNNTDQLMVEARHLMQAIREDPKKYLTIHFKLF